MALRDQPYLPLYVQDVLTDEKLIECSASAHGVYLRLMCILHKQETYGLLCMKQKYKQTQSKIENFAIMLAKQMPFEQSIILTSLTELFTEGVISIDEDSLSQKRMIYDGKLSLTRAETGKKGGNTVTKQYGKPGFLYFMSDTEQTHKIGISVNPKNRLYRLRCDNNLKNYFDIIESIPVPDMGKFEDEAQLFFKDILDGEWLTGEYNSISKRFALLKANIEAKVKAKRKANSEYESDNEDEIDIELDKIESFEEKFESAFDELTLEQIQMNFPKLDIKAELTHFMLKCNSAKTEYHTRDPDGLRLGFLTQLKNSKSFKSNGTSRKQQETRDTAAAVVEHYSEVFKNRPNG